MHARLVQAALVALVAAAAACAPHPTPYEINVSDEGMKAGVAASRYLTPVALDAVEIGRTLDADKTIKDEATSFQPRDTVYASIKISGSANSGLVRALWTDPHGQTVQDDTRIVTPSRNDLITLQVAPPNGWTSGTNRFDVYLDDRLAATKTFTVEGGGANTPNPQHGAEKANPVNH